MFQNLFQRSGIGCLSRVAQPDRERETPFRLPAMDVKISPKRRAASVLKADSNEHDRFPGTGPNSIVGD
jgi:hypothetical protein